MKRFEISEDESKAAKWPHELFLINLIFNHILLFVAFLSASALQKLVIIVPVFSFIVLVYTLVRAKRSLTVDSWYVKCHWQLAAKRSRMFIGMLLLMFVAMLVILLISGGQPRPQHFAFGGVTILPTMLTVLALIIMESDAVNLARVGQVPDWLVERYAEGAPSPIEE